MAAGDKIQSTSINSLIDTLEAVRQRHVNFENQSSAGLTALSAQKFDYKTSQGSKATTDYITQIKNYLSILAKSKFMNGTDYGSGISVPARGNKIFYNPDLSLIESAISNADGVQCVNTGYNSGFRSGYRSGFRSGYNNGYDASYNGSYNYGYDSGYNGSYNGSYRSGYNESYNSSYRSGYNESYNSSYNGSYRSSYNGSYRSGYSSCSSYRSSSNYASSNAFYSTCCAAGGYSG